ncbi:response regulator transcription factor [Streptomyces sp. NPDC102364]|uniref:response regulator transcription factor n=1 Tax=Streptomyces sp. NPDC102364 TaxID=3366161 RepID=UPI00380361F7
MGWTQAGRRGTGVLLGCGTAITGLLYLAVAGAALGPFLLRPPSRPRARAALTAGARRIAALDRRRRTGCFGDRFPLHYEPGDGEVLRYVATRAYAGTVTAVTLALIGFGVVLAAVFAAALVGGRVGPTELLWQVLLGGALLFLGVQGLRSLYALDRIRAGSAVIDPEVVRQLVGRSTRTDSLSGLTPREREVLEVLAQGHTNTGIGERLHLSLSAVEKHLNAVFDKLDLPRATGYNRRILAVLRYLEA